MDCRVHGILWARILEWVAFPLSRGSSQPRDQTQVFCITGRFFTSWATREAQEYWSGYPIPSPENLPNPGIKPGSPALQVDSLPTELHNRGDPCTRLDKLRLSHLHFYKQNLNQRKMFLFMLLLVLLLSCFSSVYDPTANHSPSKQPRASLGTWQDNSSCFPTWHKKARKLWPSCLVTSSASHHLHAFNGADP